MSPAKPTGAMALLEKYSALNRGMDEARRELARTKSKIESMRQQIQSLRVERHEMEGQTEVARQDTARLHSQVQEALAKYADLEDQHARALLAKNDACRRYEFTKQFVEEQRQDFLEASRDFRTTCKKMRLAASAVGEDTVTSKAFLEIHCQDVGGGFGDLDSDADGVGTEKDLELEQALEEHQRLKEARDEAERALREVQVKEKASSQVSASRSDRKDQLLAQLDRIRKDNADLDRQLKANDQQTREARETAHSFEKDISRRRHQSFATPSFAHNPITPSPYTASRSQHSTAGTHGTHPRNPYAKKSSESNACSDSRSVSLQSAPGGNVVMGRDWTSVEQHPHLARRIRPDRQFGTALEIISGREAEEEDIPQYEPASNHRPVYKTIHNPTSSLLDDDDDDDDDELMSYVAFSKK